MKLTTFLFTYLFSIICFAGIEGEVDSFGGNEALYQKARALNPQVENEVVQNRFTQRANRYEIAPEFASVSGGDSYNQTQNVGINAHFHVNPRWSIGLKYNYSFNSLTPEGQAMVTRASQAAQANPKDPSYLFPQVVYPKNQTMASVSWYPVVGKLSFGSLGVAHFDTYLLAGYGQMELSNSKTGTKAAGIGMGFWLNPNLTTRLEYRAQQYQAQYYNKTENLTTGVGSVQVGWML